MYKQLRYVCIFGDKEDAAGVLIEPQRQLDIPDKSGRLRSAALTNPELKLLE